MRILWLADANSAHTFRWVTALASRGLELVVFSLAEPRKDWSVGLRSVSIETAGMSETLSYSPAGNLRKLVYLRAVPKILRVFRAFGPEVVHAHYASSYGLLATLANLRPRIVSVWGSDVYETPEVSPIHRWVIRRVLDSANRVLSTSLTMQSHVRGLTSRDIGVIPFGVDVRRFAPLGGADRRNAAFRIGTVKSLEAKYGMEYLIRAFAVIRRRRPDLQVSLTIVGEGSLAEPLKGLARDLGVLEETEFVGSVPYDQVHRYHQSLDVGVYPSIEESFGVSAVESQACGVPTIVSRVGGLPEVVDEGRTAVVVPPRDPEAIAAAVIDLLDHPETRNRMAGAARERVLANYSLDGCVDEICLEYRKLGLRGP